MKNKVFSICLFLLFFVSCKEVKSIYPVNCETSEQGNIFIFENVASEIKAIYFYRDNESIGMIQFNSYNKRPESLSFIDYYVTPGKEYSYSIKIYSSYYDLLKEAKFNVVTENGHGEIDIEAPFVSFSSPNINGNITGTVSKIAEWKNRWIPKGFYFSNNYSSYMSDDTFLGEIAVSENETTFLFEKVNKPIDPECIIWQMHLIQNNSQYYYKTFIWGPFVRITIPTDKSCFDLEIFKNQNAFGYAFCNSCGVSEICLWGPSDNYPDFWKIYRDMPDDFLISLQSLENDWISAIKSENSDQLFEIKKQILEKISELEEYLKSEENEDPDETDLTDTPDEENVYDESEILPESDDSV